ncbi:MAG: phosphatidate cytidylyltransferase [Lentisphaeria bacterium]|nr:phosphatidate cytidylyltransferase [Lentisphaeria bacterium]
MFKFRVIGFILLIALLGGIFFWKAGGFWLFLAAAPAMCAAAVGECCLMLRRSGRPAFPLPGAILSWAFPILLIVALRFDWLWSSPAALLILPVAVFFAGLIGILLMRPRLMEGIFTTLGVTGMLTWSLGALLMTYTLPPYGYWLFFLCLATKATDTGGYIVGTLTAKLPGGNHKIAPSVSPKKSWEGLVGGFLLSLAVAWAFYRFGNAHVDLYIAPPSLWWYLTAGAVLSIGSFFGDLTESAIKRMCGVKDSGGFVPGMGGAFDVLDSFLYNGMLFWILVIFA